MAHQPTEPSQSIKYEPVYDAPASPRLPPANADPSTGGFYDNPAYHGSTASFSPSFQPQPSYRGSEYDSVHRLGPSGGYRDDPNAVAMNDLGARGGHPMEEKRNAYASPKKKRNKTLLCAGIICAIILILAAIILPVYFAVIRPKLNNNNSNSSNNSNSDKNGDNKDDNKNDNNNAKTLITTGGDGSEIEMEDGTKFTYHNTFGGFWIFDPANPTNDSARCQSHTPPLDEPFQYGTDRIRGVNLGGWLNLEPFISPAMYEEFYPDAVDEWTLSEQIQARYGNLDKIEEHYKTFITEQDFAMIAGAGLNWIRLPIAFWAIETYPGEPYLEGVSWQYFLKAIQWARKYGLRINLDLHALPGSQNGWNHSGKLGEANWLNGAMGLANAQRSLDYIRILTEFISQPEYKNVIPFFGFINEPRVGPVPRAALENFYAEVYRMARNVGGFGEGNGPMLSIHEGFAGVDQWNGFLAGADRVAMDWHPYFAFGDPSADPLSSWRLRPCTAFGPMATNSMRGFGVTAAGEWSNAINDCGLYLNAVGVGTRYEGTFPGYTTRLGSCATWTNWDAYTQETRDGLRDFMMASMDALQDYFFWTWNIGNSSATGKVETPFWSYKLALQEGWAPTDPRDAVGQCERMGVPFDRFTGDLDPHQVGRATTYDVPTLASHAWPPPAIGGYPNTDTLPRYNPTGRIPIPPSPVFKHPDTDEDIDMGDGWTNEADRNRLMSVPDPTCAYPNAWDAVDAVPPVCASIPPIVGFTL